MDEQTQQKVLKAVDSIGQNAHVLFGIVWVWLFTFVFVTILKEPNVTLLNEPEWLNYSILIYIGLTAFKEFYYDNRYEIPEIRGSSLKDFIFYQVGWISGLFLYKMAILIQIHYYVKP